MAGGTIAVIVAIAAVVAIFAYLSFKLQATVVQWSLRLVILVVAVALVLALGYYADAI